MTDLTKLSAEVAMLREALSEIITQDDAHELDSRHINKGRDAIAATEATAAAWEQRVRDEALERAAAECERMMMYPGGRQESAAHDNVWEAAKAIRAMKGKQ